MHGVNQRQEGHAVIGVKVTRDAQPDVEMTIGEDGERGVIVAIAGSEASEGNAATFSRIEAHGNASVQCVVEFFGSRDGEIQPRLPMLVAEKIENLKGERRRPRLGFAGGRDHTSRELCFLLFDAISASVKGEETAGVHGNKAQANAPEYEVFGFG